MESWEDSQEAKLSATWFHDSNEDVRTVVHDDDFVCLSDDHGLEHISQLLKSIYTAKKTMGRLGFEDSDREKCSVVEPCV